MNSRTKGTPNRAQPQTTQFTGELAAPLIKSISLNDHKRNDSINQLVSQAPNLPNLAVLLWFSPGTVTSLLNDVLENYDKLTTGRFFEGDNSKLLNVFELFKIIAAHKDTSILFVRANLPIYFFPYLQFTMLNPSLSNISGAVLAIFTTLIQSADLDEIVRYLLKTEFMSICLRLVINLRGVAKNAAGFLLERIISVNSGRKLICSNPEKIASILSVFNSLMIDLSSDFIPVLSGYITTAYKALLAEPEIAEIAAATLPEVIKTMPLSMSCDAAHIELIGQLRNLDMKRR